ncbi:MULTISPECIES: DUF4113 domain-containing protein [Acaryochloris]|nr:DUF4113 domain-containing protein [Acaryochloris marina]
MQSKWRSPRYTTYWAEVARGELLS